MRQSWANQGGFDVRFEWGPAGVAALAQDVEALVIVDVLRFTTAVDAAVSRGARVYPHPWKDESSDEFAQAVGAGIGPAGEPTGISLSPVRLLQLAPGEEVVLPSPNGSTCAALASEAGVEVVAACIRSGAAVAAWLDEHSGPVGVIACGELWPDGSLRPALEDHIGAGPVIARLTGRRSPEADLAASAWNVASESLWDVVSTCVSGRELVTKG